MAESEDEKNKQLPCINRYLNEPMLCRESTCGRIPESLKIIYNRNEPKSTFEAILFVIYILQIEYGFIPYHDNESKKYQSDLDEWRSTGCFKIKFKRVFCDDVIAALTCVNLGQNIIVSGTVESVSEMCQFKFKLSEYTNAIDTDPFEVYKNLQKLSLHFKNSISAPLSQMMVTKAGVAHFEGICALPYEVLTIILKYLDVQTCSKVMQVNKLFLSVAKEPLIWRFLYLKDFGGRDNNNLNQDWYYIYKEKYLYIKSLRRTETEAFRDYGFNPFPIPNPLNPYPWNHQHHHGIIGGAYDLDPFANSRDNLPRALNPRRSGFSHFSLRF